MNKAIEKQVHFYRKEEQKNFNSKQKTYLPTMNEIEQKLNQESTYTQ